MVSVGYGAEFLKITVSKAQSNGSMAKYSLCKYQDLIWVSVRVLAIVLPFQLHTYDLMKAVEDAPKP